MNDGITITEAAKVFAYFLSKAKNNDSALSAFDRSVKAEKIQAEAEKIQAELIPALRLLFQPIREERLRRRTLTDIGGVSDKIVYKKSDVDYNLKLARKILLTPKSNKIEVLLSLLLVTGRRTGEVCGTTEFLPTEFIGTLKGGKERGKAHYLVPFACIENGVRLLRISGLRGLTPQQTNAKIAVQAMRKLPMFKGVNKVHELRKMYLAICVNRLKNAAHVKRLKPTQRQEIIGEFVNNVLGHSNPISALPYLNCQIQD